MHISLFYLYLYYMDHAFALHCYCYFTVRAQSRVQTRARKVHFLFFQSSDIGLDWIRMRVIDKALSWSLRS